MLEAEAAPGPGLTGVGSGSEENNEEARDWFREPGVNRGDGETLGRLLPCLLRSQQPTSGSVSGGGGVEVDEGGMVGGGGRG